MGPQLRNAWITVVADRASVQNAIVLAKSLSRVVTLADIVVLTSHEIFHAAEGKQLAQYFDAVLPQSITTADVNGGDQLKMQACHLQMYSTCIILSPNKMVVKNCDELFGLEKDFAAVTTQNNENKFDSSAFLIRPKKFLRGALEIINITGLRKLSDVFDFFNQQENKEFICQLPKDYNYNVSKSLPNVEGLHSAKIVDFGDINLLKNIKQMDSMDKEKLDTWISYHETVVNNLNVEFAPERNDMFSETGDRSYYRNAVAIVGYSCRFPGANSTDEFWDLLKRGGDGISRIPSERLADFQRNDPRHTESWGGFLKCPIDEFDAKFFGISPREATSMDPQQRLLLEVAWEALENSAINPHSLKGGNTGVFTGVWQHYYERLVTESASAQDFLNVILGNAFSATSARVSYFLGLNGPNIAIESGCSSSMIGLHLACESLRKQETNLCLVLGANILAVNIPSSSIPVVAKDGRCKTFDEKADGFARAEGIAGIVLKRLPDAIKDGDRIMGIIRGSGVTNEGTSCSFGTPSKHCQEVAVKEALKNAGVRPNDVDCVEAHGTGTPVGDPIEFAALSAAYAEGNREKPLLIGSVKTNTGHTESAAGMAGLFKVLLSMKHETIPPHINFTTVNPNIDLNAIPAKIPTECENWKRNPDRKRIAGISSFGISGGNVHVILEEPPLNCQLAIHSAIDRDVDQSHRILTISAKSENALFDLSKKYIDYFQCNPNANFADVAFTANNGRANFKFRSAFVAKDIKELTLALKSNATYEPPLLNFLKPKIAFLFTGQGSQYFGMGKDLYYSNLVFRNAFDNCDHYLQSTVGISLKCALWDETQKDLLDQTMYSQLSIFTVQYSLLKLWDSFGINPEFVLGHSVGEYAASVAAGILNFKDALDLIVERNRLIDTLPEGAMLAVKASKDMVSELILKFSSCNPDLFIDVACINSPNQTVVAGKKHDTLQFQEFCAIQEIKTQLLASTQGFHSRCMAGVVKQFADFAKKFEHLHSKCIYVSGKTGEYVVPGGIDYSYWPKHLRETVNFEKGMNTLLDNECNVFVEIGSHPILLALGMANSLNTRESIWLPSLRRKESCWKTILQSLGELYTNGAAVDWKSLDFPNSRNKLELPTYPFQRRKYWTDYHYPEDIAHKLHPLLGRKIYLADQNVHIYENHLNLKDFQFLKDHQVANIILFPAAGFLEIVLACARDVLKENFAIADFSVEAPFELEGGKQYKLQSVLHPADNNEGKMKFSILVFQNVNGYNDEKGWKSYASAVIIPGTNVSVSNGMNVLDIEKFQLSCELKSKGPEMYKHMSDVSVNLGESFQSVKTTWKTGNELLAEISAPLKDYSMAENYVCHPLVSDAMFQLLPLTFNAEDKDMYLPVAIEKVNFIKFSENSKTFYAHAIPRGNLSGDTMLYNENNELLVVLEGMRMVRTSVNSFLNIANTVTNKLPGMYQDVLRSKDAPHRARIDLIDNGLLFESNDSFLDELQKTVKEERDFHLQFTPMRCPLFCTVHILKFFHKVKWNPKIGDCLDCRSFLIDRGYLLSVENIISRFFEILSEDGYLKKEGTTTDWTVVQNLPTQDEINVAIQNYDTQLAAIERRTNKRHVFSYMVKYCTDQLQNICEGTMTAHSVLFDNQDPNLNASKVYTDAVEIKYDNKCISTYLQMIFKELGLNGNNKGPILRIIELGAGSGATTSEIIQGLNEKGIPFRYTFTDVSSLSINEAKIKFVDESNMDFGILDIEKDPLSQGFAPYHYDVVVASNVINSTSSLHQSLNNARVLLRPDGYLLLQEILGMQRNMDIIFGVLEGYWKFNDFEIRPNHPCVAKHVWDQVLLKSGFEVSKDTISDGVLVTRAVGNYCAGKDSINSLKDKTWILYCDTDGVYEHLELMLESVGRKVYLIKDINDYCKRESSTNAFYINTMVLEEFGVCLNEIFDNNNVEGCCYLRSVSDYPSDDQSRICLPAFNFIKNAISKNRVASFCVATSGVYYNTANHKTMSPHKSTLIGLFKTVANECGTLRVKLVDLDPDCEDMKANAAELFHELFSGDDGICSYINHKKSVLRMCEMPKPSSPLILPQGRFTVVKPSSKEIKDLQFQPLAKIPLQPQEIEVLVKSTAINFRDLLIVLQPDQYTSKYSDSIGTDFAGIVSDAGSLVTKHRIGDRVFGITINTCVASHVIVGANSAVKIPSSFTFSEACTLPSVFLTAQNCLVTIGNLKKGETVLIHVASGGVGLIAIQIAKLIGARIIATAGSHRKRAYLRSIGVEDVFHSRDLTYEDGIRKATNGKGVDVVLNSLTGPGFKEATLNVCGLGARFVEIGKINIWTTEEIKSIRPDVQYAVFDLEKEDFDEAVKLWDKYNPEVTIFPLPLCKFPVCQIRESLRYFAKAENIGKVVLFMPEIKECNGRQFANDFNFEDFGTYLITGGLSGIGLEVAKWMVDSGAKNLVLVARSPPNDDAQKEITKLKGKGCRVENFQVDIGDWEQSSKLFELIKSSKCKLPPLKGIIHSAGVISDTTLTNQTWENFETVFNAKVSGGWNLHNLSKGLRLDYFVMFSSLSALIGSIGQSNYAAANMFLDSLVQYRHSIGLPAQSINWGAWANIGKSANIDAFNKGTFGISFFSPSQGIAALKFIMSQPNLKQVAIAQLNVKELIDGFGNKGNYFSELLEDEDENSMNQVVASSETFWVEIDALDFSGRVTYIKKYLQKTIKKTLRLPETDSLDEFQNFSDMGLDSLMGVEIKNKLQKVVGKHITLNATSMLDFPTIHKLGQHLAEQTLAAKDSPQITKGLQNDYDLVKLDSILPLDIKSISESYTKPSEVMNILLTGATGRFGIYLLRDLLKFPNLNVFCLIRGKSVENARKKLLATIVKFQLQEELNLDSISVVLGNIAEFHFGLAKESYDSISAKIDCVIHLAVKANHIEKYVKAKSGITDIRSVNVFGTLNILRFASNIKTKRVFYSSSFSTINRLTDDGFIYEDFPDENNNGDQLKWGYVLSKFVCEKLMKQANERGIPCTVVRYLELTGDSRTGVFAVDNNSFMNFNLLFFRYGVIPEINGGWCFMPVDVASTLTVKFIFNDDIEPGVYNFTPPCPIYTQDFVNIVSELGYPLKVVSDDEFLAAVTSEKENDAWISIFSDSFGSDLKSVAIDATASGIVLKDKKLIYRISNKILTAIPNFQEHFPDEKAMLTLYVKFANSVGILKEVKR